MDSSGRMCKFLAIVALVAFADYANALSAEQKAVIQSKLLATGLSCIKDHPLSLSDIQAFKDKMMPDGKEAKCFTACLFKKIGIMDDMGKLNAASAKENAKKLFKNSEEHAMKIDEIVNACSSVNDQATSDGAKGCERAHLAFGCLVKSADKLGFDIDL